MRGFLVTARGGSGPSGIAITKLHVDDGIINSGVRHYRELLMF